MKDTNSRNGAAYGPRSGQAPTHRVVSTSLASDSKGGVFMITVTLAWRVLHRRITLADRAAGVANRARRSRDPNIRIAVAAIDPSTAFPKDGKYDIVVIGESFSEVPEDNVLVFEGRDELDDVAWSAEAAKPGKVRGILHSTHKLEFRNIPAKYWGTEHIRIRVGERYSDPPLPVTLSGFGATIPLVASLGVMVLLALLVSLLATKGLKRAKVDDQIKSALTTLLLDPETDSYSLSKFQLYCWTAAAIFGYAYLLITRALIQGKFEFAPVPENLPGLLLVSGATWAVAKSITSVRGPKGAGDVQPCMSDFITVGGVVSAERFQFFVWTVLGVLSFFFLIVAQAPTQFQDLPRIPESFISLMGVSSAGYLGGKLARKPGPIIDSIVAQPGSLVVEIVGRCLSRDASFRIEDADVTTTLVGVATQAGAAAVPATLPAAAPAAPAPSSDAELLVVRKDDGSPDQATFASELRLTIRAPQAWLSAHQLRTDLFNPIAPAAVGAAAPAVGNAVGAAAAPQAPLKPRLTIVNPEMARWQYGHSW